VTDLRRVGTRRSALARIQTEMVVASLRRRTPDTRFEVVPIETSGDRERAPGVSPDFTDAIDRALRKGAVDLAVHSAKDLPLRLDPALLLAACPRRANPRDALVQNVRRLPRGAKVGSSSLRRRAQLLRWRGDLEVVELRGNVDTRLVRVRSGTLDAVILAAAGLERLGLKAEISEILPIRSFLPAPAQGALALVTRSDDTSTTSIARTVGHPTTLAAVQAEREFASVLGGDCRMPLAALARLDGDSLNLTGEVLSPDGRQRLRGQLAGDSDAPARVGAALGTLLRDRGAIELLHPGG
jgi:hydroxymethylbilane synthase